MQKADFPMTQLIDHLLFIQEILAGFVVKNLDTGETTNLKDAEKQIPKCVDPLVLHIIERTKDYPR